MINNVTVIMYHFIRDLVNSRYAKIKGLDVKLFEKQLILLKNKYIICSMEEIIYYNKNNIYKPNLALLTFDDGYADHYTFVLPLLIKYNLKGSFFIPAKLLDDHHVLDVNKIHFILASNAGTKDIINDISIHLLNLSQSYNLKTFDYYFKKLAKESRFDDANTIFIKRLLQVELNKDIRKIILDFLFKKYINIEENIFSKELYLSIDQIKCMKKLGMHIGAHGYNHDWLANLSYDDQYNEILKSVNFLKNIQVDKNEFTMCYPYGSYNLNTIEILNKFNFKLAFTTKVGLAKLDEINKFELARFDTNDFIIN